MRGTSTALIFELNGERVEDSWILPLKDYCNRDRSGGQAIKVAWSKCSIWLILNPQLHLFR